MRKCLILFALIFAYIWGCSASEEDKYSLLTKDDRLAIKTYCDCMSPLTYYTTKMKNAKDSLTELAYLDSFQIKVIELEPCIEKAEKMEIRYGLNEKYNSQFIQYVRDKHPDCEALWLGTNVSDSVKNKHK